ncbi:MAG TPA: hypothetical protein VH186_17195 [Chloroflexia bacterium]|nr:hypothetical protein [Chloroflexia bacterium]
MFRKSWLQPWRVGVGFYLSPVLVVTIFVLNLFLAGGSVEAADDSQYFPETGQVVSGPFLNYWRSHGGLAIYGYPISDAHNEIDPQTGQSFRVQWFERNRFEYHPEKAGTPYEVLLGLLGRQETAGRENEEPFQPTFYFPDNPNQRYFLTTGHSLTYGFKAYWESHGGLAQFGFPISEAFSEQTDRGTYTVQYFERARFEYHPENPASYNVLLGLLGSQLVKPIDRPYFEVQAGSVRSSVTQDHTALLLPGSNIIEVKAHFPYPVNSQLIQSELKGLAAPNWQIIPLNQPDSNTYRFVLTGNPAAASYLTLNFFQQPVARSLQLHIQIVRNAGAQPPLLDDRSDPARVLASYYNAVNRQEYDRAYSYWELPGNSATSLPPDYASFVQGYANTASVIVLTGEVRGQGAAGRAYFSVPTVLLATMKDGSLQRYYGCYLLTQQHADTGKDLPPYPVYMNGARIFAGTAPEGPYTLLSRAQAFTNQTLCAPAA